MKVKLHTLWSLGAAVVVPSLILGCAGAATPSTAARSPEHVEVPRLVVTPDVVASIDELFARAERDLELQHYESAASGFQRVYELDPTGPRAADALFWQGTAEDLAGRPSDALESYDGLSNRFSGSPHARTALIRRTRLNAYFERYEAAGSLADRALATFRDLRPFELITLFGAKAMSLVVVGDDVHASYFVEKARTVIEDNGLDAAGEVPRDLALVYFALGEIRRIRAERIKFVPMPPDFAQVLEQRCQLILDAQSSYSDTMRAHDAHWSAMAGYRVGELYQRLHDDLMRVPAPQSANTQGRELLFEGAMRLRYSILLDKARAMLEHTLEMAKRTGERSAWVTRAEQALAELERAVAREQQAIDALPYSRAQLQEALDELGRRASAKP